MDQKFPLIKIVHIASGDLWAGAEVQLFTLAKALQHFDNLSIQVILLNHGELESRLRKLDITVEVLDESRLNSLQILWQVTKLLKMWRPDVVHTHRLKENILGGFASSIAGNIPSMRTVHGAQEHPPGWHKPHKWGLHKLDYIVGRFLQRKIIAVSKPLADQLQKHFPAPKIAIIENGVDIEPLSQYVKTKDRLDFPTSPIKVGLIGRLVPVKRVDIFIETAKYFQDHYPNLDVHFHIYGEGPLQGNLENFAATLGVKDIVHFEGHRSEIYPEMATLDALLITSDHEGLPMTLLEAMTLRVPIIAHAVGGIPNALEQGKCGTLIRQNMSRKYAEAIYNCFQNNHEQEKRINLARTRVIEKYSALNNVQSYLLQYQSVVSNFGDS